MSEQANNSDRQPTNILLDQEIDTPYPYCVLPRRHSRGVPMTIQKPEMPLQGKLRTILSVSTWDGRELMNLRTGN